MSTSTNTRNTAYNDRRTATTSGAKPRLASHRTAAKDRSSSSGDIGPDDSASKAPRRADASIRTNGSARSAAERQTERVRSQITSRESLQVRTKSPVKSSVKSFPVNGSGEDIRPSRASDYHRTSSPAAATAPVPPKEKVALRKCGSRAQPGLHRDSC